MCVNSELGCWAMGCSDVMSGDAGCYHGYWWDATCRMQEFCLWFVMVTTLNELQSCRRGNSYGDGHQTCWYLGDCECWGWVVTVRYWCVVLGWPVFRHCNVSSEVRVEQEGGNTQWKYWDRVWRLGSFPPPPPPPSPTPHSCCININKYIGRLANSLH